jgi:sugar (pentulose or hexulose) kinase
MRTTLEVSDAHRARLLDLAARRGEKGFSSIVAEALDLYFSQAARQENKVRAATAVLGTLDAEAADRFEAIRHELRTSWR